MNEEVWRIVPSQPELRASSWGRIFRSPFQKGMPNGANRWYRMQPTFGYRAKMSGLAGFRMIVRIGSLRKTFKIARLVCEAFHGAPPFPRAVVMHKDDNPGNNRPENLRWGTQKENLNADQFIAYCKSRTGQSSTHAKSRRP